MNVHILKHLIHIFVLFPKMFSAAILLFFQFGTSNAKTSGGNKIIKIGHINMASVTGVLEANATFAFAIKKIRQLKLIKDNVQFQ